MEIRTERPTDYDEVFRLHFKAFGHRENESRLIERIRASDRFLPDISLVAEENGQVVGHALFSKAELADGKTIREVIVLAPIAVLCQAAKEKA